MDSIRSERTGEEVKALGRLTLVALTVGGGFTGLAATLQAMLSGNYEGIDLLFCAVGGLAYAIVLSVGLWYVHNPSRLLPLAAVFAMQIPYVTSPYFVYRVFAGGEFLVWIIGVQIGFTYGIGAQFELQANQPAPTGVGINLIAFAVFVVLVAVMLSRRSRRRTMFEVR